MSDTNDSAKMWGGIVNRARADGRPAYYVPVRYRDGTGRTKQKWLGPYTKREDADKGRTTFKANLLKGQRPQPKGYTVGKLLDDWLSSIELELTASTFTSYSRRANKHIRPLLGSRPLTEVEPIEIEAFKAALRRRGLGPAGQSQVFQALSAARRYAVRLRKIAQSPAAFVRWPAYHAPKRPVIGEEDAAKIIEVARGSRLGLAIELILYTGLRRSEALTLRWGSVDLEAGTLMVGKSKTPAGVRLFPLPPIMVDLLKAYRPPNARPKEVVFSRQSTAGRRSRPGAPLALDSLDKAWGVIREQAGYPNLHLHDLRHGFATIAIKSGVDLVHLAELLGHKNASITASTYSHVTAEGRREAAEKVADALRRGQESRVARKLLDGVLDGAVDQRP
jgi:integrase